MEQVLLSHNRQFLGPYDSTVTANLAARQLVQASGSPVTVYVYDVYPDAKALRRKYRVLRKLDGTTTFAS